jgi:hypothetical protein
MTSINFKKIHNFGSDRITVLEKVSNQVVYCNTSATAVDLYKNGYYFSVSVAHFKCNKACPKDLLHCPGLDVSLIPRCPIRQHSLDVTSFSDGIIGDDAFVYGFGVASSIRNYRASIGGLYNFNITGEPFNGEAIVKSHYRLLVGGHQTPGFSGSCVLNGYNIIGLACVTLHEDSYKTNAVIVPWKDVDACITQAFDDQNIRFPTKCESNVILTPPTLYNRVEVNVVPLINKYEFGRSVADWLYKNF